jgi:hypothetical protein
LHPIFELFETIGASPKKRLLIIGWKVTDISINEFDLGVDAKPRNLIPKSYMVDKSSIIGGLYCIPLNPFLVFSAVSTNVKSAIP